MKISNNPNQNSQFKYGGKVKFLPIWLERKEKINSNKTIGTTKPTNSTKLTYTYSIRFNRDIFKWLFVTLFAYVLFSSCNISIVIQ